MNGSPHKDGNTKPAAVTGYTVVNINYIAFVGPDFAVLIRPQML